MQVTALTRHSLSTVLVHIGRSSAAQQDATRSFKNVYRRKQIPPGGRAWYGHVWRGKQQLKTSFFHTAEEAARAVDRCGVLVVPGRQAAQHPAILLRAANACARPAGTCTRCAAPRRATFPSRPSWRRSWTPSRWSRSTSSSSCNGAVGGHSEPPGCGAVAACSPHCQGCVRLLVQALNAAHRQVHRRVFQPGAAEVAGDREGHIGWGPAQEHRFGLQCQRGAGGGARQRRGVRAGRQVRAQHLVALRSRACVEHDVVRTARAAVPPSRAAAQVHHPGALGPLQQPGACARSGRGRTCRRRPGAALSLRTTHLVPACHVRALHVQGGRWPWRCWGRPRWRSWRSWCGAPR